MWFNYNSDKKRAGRPLCHPNEKQALKLFGSCGNWHLNFTAKASNCLETLFKWFDGFVKLLLYGYLLLGHIHL